MYHAKLIEDSMNEIYIFDAMSLKFISCNKASLSNLGYTQDEILELTPLDLKPEYTEEQFRHDVLQPLIDGEESHIMVETKHKRKNGSLYDARIKLQLIIDEDGPIFAAIIEDITDRLKTRNELEKYRAGLEDLVRIRTEELHEALDMYKTLARMSPVGIMRLDKAGKCIFSNKKWRELTGQSKEESLGDGWLNAIHMDDRRGVEGECQRAIDADDATISEFRIIDKDGSTLWVVCSCNKIAGGVCGHVMTFTNVTKKKEILPQLLDLQVLMKSEALKRGNGNGG